MPPTHGTPGCFFASMFAHKPGDSGDLGREAATTTTTTPAVGGRKTLTANYTPPQRANAHAWVHELHKYDFKCGKRSHEHGCKLAGARISHEECVYGRSGRVVRCDLCRRHECVCVCWLYAARAEKVLALVSFRLALMAALVVRSVGRRWEQGQALRSTRQEPNPGTPGM